MTKFLILKKHCFSLSETLIFFPSFNGASFVWLNSYTLIPGNQNEITLFIKTTQLQGTVLYASTNGNQDDLGDSGAQHFQTSFVQLYLEAGSVNYAFSCDGTSSNTIATGSQVNTGDVYEIIIR